MSLLLQVRHLTVAFDTDSGQVRAVDDAGFSVDRNRTLGIVGESGCGKSVTALSLMRLLPMPSGKILRGEILFEGRDLLKLSVEEMTRIRGRRMAMIFQEPMTALNPVHRIGKQVSEVFRLHFPDMSENKILTASLDMLNRVGIPEPEQRLREYPHQLSGGMRQRVMIAIALACKPDILIADEPTTALDVTIQAQILTLIKDLQNETGMSVIFITHDLGVIAEICDSVVVMYAGRVAETAGAGDLFTHPAHPYTRGLLSSIPRLETPRKTRLNIIEGVVPGLDNMPDGCRFQNRCPHARPVCARQPDMQTVAEGHEAACHFSHDLPVFEIHPAPHHEKEQVPQSQTWDSPCLEVHDLKMHFPVRGGIFMRQIGKVYAVDGVSFKVRKGKTLGLVGESGCGKTTLGRCVVRLYHPTAGEVIFNGKNILKADRASLQSIRRDVQMIFQDPFESLNNRHTVGEILEEPFIIHHMGTPAERRENVKALLDRVGLSPGATLRFPHEFSGGQRQRIGIARAISLNPDLIVCDEPVSALDVSIQSQILNLLLEFQRDMGLTYLFISHDLTVVKHISDHVAVMYLGKIVEHTDADAIYKTPLHPYTQALLSAIPIPIPGAKDEKQILSGELPSPIRPPSGCRFRTRCPIRIEQCIHEEPLLAPAPGTKGGEHLVACHRVSS